MLTAKDASKDDGRGLISRLLKNTWLRLVAILIALGTIFGGLDAFFNVVDRGLAWFKPPAVDESIQPTPASSPTSTPVPKPTKGTDGYGGGWGPERQMFTMKAPADYPVLNAIRDYPDVGDLRDFVTVRNLSRNGDDADFEDIVRADVGEKVQFLVALANCAADNLEESISTINGLKARIYNPDLGRDLSISVVAEGTNATTVWDGASVVASSEAWLEVQESAYFYSGGGTYYLDDDFYSGSWVPVGWSQPDGVFPVGRDTNGVERGFGFIVIDVIVRPLP